MVIRAKDKKTAKSSKGTRIEKRQLTEAELDQVSGGDNFGNII